MIAVIKGVTDDLLTWLGVKCSSSTQVNVGTSRRSYLLPLGDLSKRSVRESNVLVSRSELKACSIV